MNTNKKEFIIWNGDNTEEVLDFCVSWRRDLCKIHSTFNNLITGVLTLNIEPCDTMRGYGVNIPINKKVVRGVKNGYIRTLEVLDE